MLSERPLKYADQKTERGKVINPQYSIDRDQPTSRASPRRINTLLFRVFVAIGANCGHAGGARSKPPQSVGQIHHYHIWKVGIF